MPDSRGSSEAPVGLRADAERRGRTHPTTRELVDAVRARAACGDSLGEVVRDVLEPAEVNDDVRSALWLMAWVRCESAARPARQLEHLTGVPAG